MNLLFILVFCIFSFFCEATPPKPLSVGIIIPIEHQALRDIIRGYKETLGSLYKGPLTFRVENAGGDMALQKAIIQKLNQSAVDIIVPISTTTTQMAIKMVKKIPIVSLASAYTKTDPHMRAPNLTGVTDEFSPALLLTFLKKAYPQCKSIVLVHSSNDKVMKTAETLLQNGQREGIRIHRRMISGLSDLYALKDSLPKESSHILILKDCLVASGIATLVQTAQKTGRILMTSDEGTVKEGAHFALGVSEYAIGEKGAEQTLKIIGGDSPNSLPFMVFEKPQLYVNADFPQKAAIQDAAKTLGYPVTLVGRQ